ncbi:MAG: hypothetical protein AB7U95_23340 [Reyranella sp.]
MGNWRDTPMGALGAELFPLLQRFLGPQANVFPRLAAYDFHSATDPTGARALVAMMVDAAIERVGADVVGECFAAATRFRCPDLVGLVKSLEAAYGRKELGQAMRQARQRGQLPTGSAALVYVWTEVSVRGEIDPWTYNHRPGIERDDVFKTMDRRKWFIDRVGNPFRASRENLSRYYRRERDAVAKNGAKAAAVAALIQIKLSRLAHDAKSVPPANQRWPRPVRAEE